MKKYIYKFIFFQCMGWKINGLIDPKIPKSVIIVLPHTSWHDFFVGFFTRGILEVEINWIGKKELFKFPMKYYFKWMGGAPIDRTGNLNKVDAIVEIFKSKKIFRLGISPEGTRKKVSELKTGFYYIAHKAQVPIIPVAFNYRNKVVDIANPFYTTGNIADDLAFLMVNFKDVVGKIPENSFEVNL